MTPELERRRAFIRGAVVGASLIAVAWLVFGRRRSELVHLIAW